MSTLIRPELSADSKYHISKHRYYELKHHCLQYYEWKQQIRYLESLTQYKESEDPTGNTATTLTLLRNKIQTIDYICSHLRPDCAKYIHKAVTQGKSYSWLCTNDDCLVPKDRYYDEYHRFFYLLSGRI